MKRIIVLSVLSLTLFSSCRQIFGKRIRGNGHVKTEARSSGNFNNVAVSGNIDVYIKQDSVSSVRVEADENLLAYIIVENKGDTLNIHPKENIRLKSSKGIKIYISNPLYKHFETSGACDILSENKINSSGTLTFNLTGAGEIKMELNAPVVKVDLSGAGNVTLSGETKDLLVDGSGATEINCFDLKAENTRVDISGAGDAEVFASVKLDVHVSGSADVKYKGNAIVTKSISGAGSVKKVDAP
ncbi:MAG TPA: head GIN domain-containing protein [Chitinophagaceae bacterium]|nr:head GIN domain-containing protein [Chitinophagaceae bacterium]